MENGRRFKARLSEICKILEVDCPIEDRIITKIAYIRRDIEEGCVYFAFKNPHLDTYANIGYAIEQGVAMIVTEKYIEDYPCIVVKDSLKAYMKLAGWYRESLDVEIVGITGSVGKTSTKEMIFSALNVSSNGLVEKNFENANLLESAGKNVLNLHENTEILLQEITIHDAKKASLAIVPTIAVITNIGVSHIKLYGSREEIFRKKLEILCGMKEGKLFLNIDDDMLYDYFKAAKRDCISYGIENEDADCRALDIKQTENGYCFTIHYRGRQWGAETSCPGKYNVLNALVAFAVGYELGRDEDSLIEGIKQYQPSGFRQNILQARNTTLFVDCYNAAPDSMKVALDTLESVSQGKKKVAVLGDMLELGECSKQLHEDVGYYLNTKEIDELICYGNESRYIYNVVDSNKIKVSFTLYQKELKRLLEEAIKTDSVILFKASRGIMLEEIIDDVFHTNLCKDSYKDNFVWNVFEREGKDIKTYLEEKGYSSVAVYGLTTVGGNLTKYLNREGVQVKYAIDSRAKYAPAELYPYPIYTLDGELPNVDAILISYYSNVEEIIHKIKTRVDIPCIPYRQIVEDMLG